MRVIIYGTSFVSRCAVDFFIRHDTSTIERRDGADDCAHIEPADVFVVASSSDESNALMASFISKVYPDSLCIVFLNKMRRYVFDENVKVYSLASLVSKEYAASIGWKELMTVGESADLCWSFFALSPSILKRIKPFFNEKSPQGVLYAHSDTEGYRSCVSYEQAEDAPYLIAVSKKESFFSFMAQLSFEPYTPKKCIISGEYGLAIAEKLESIYEDMSVELVHSSQNISVGKRDILKKNFLDLGDALSSSWYEGNVFMPVEYDNNYNIAASLYLSHLGAHVRPLIWGNIPFNHVLNMGISLPVMINTLIYRVLSQCVVKASDRQPILIGSHGVGFWSCMSEEGEGALGDRVFKKGTWESML